MFKKSLLYLSLGLGSLLLLETACDPKPDDIGPVSPTVGSLDSIPYNPVAYDYPQINGLPTMEEPSENRATEAGVKLGRYLFYERKLSIDSSISCASCHHQDRAFTDGNPVGIGVGGAVGTRNSMSLINVGYNWKQNSQHNFNWDGKFASLEEQVLSPVEHPLEMMSNWEEVMQRLKGHEHYPRMFRQAFGIEHIDEMSKELAAKALAQFLRTLNSADSEYDRDEWVPFQYMSEAAQRGKLLFLGDALGSASTKDAECGHCHSFTRDAAIFARNSFSNNAIDSVSSFMEFSDNGLGDVTGSVVDNGRFREVSLRNVGLTAPYMHDGRFATLEEVLDHYTEHTSGSRGPNVANELSTAPELPHLTAQEKQDIIAFLHALTDTSYVNKAEWADPFLQADPWAE